MKHLGHCGRRWIVAETNRRTPSDAGPDRVSGLRDLTHNGLTRDEALQGATA